MFCPICSRYMPSEMRSLMLLSIITSEPERICGAIVSSETANSAAFSGMDCSIQAGMGRPDNGGSESASGFSTSSIIVPFAAG